MARIFSFIIILIIIVLGLFFGSINAETVKFDYFFGTADVALSIAMVLSLFVGAILGVIACMTLIIRLRRQVSKLQKAVATVEKEVTNLRTIPLKDDR